MLTNWYLLLFQDKEQYLTSDQQLLHSIPMCIQRDSTFMQIIGIWDYRFHITDTLKNETQSKFSCNLTTRSAVLYKCNFTTKRIQLFLKDTWLTTNNHKYTDARYGTIAFQRLWNQNKQGIAMQIINQSYNSIIKWKNINKIRFNWPVKAKERIKIHRKRK